MMHVIITQSDFFFCKKFYKHKNLGFMNTLTTTVLASLGWITKQPKRCTTLLECLDQLLPVKDVGLMVCFYCGCGERVKGIHIDSDKKNFQLLNSLFLDYIEKPLVTNNIKFVLECYPMSALGEKSSEITITLQWRKSVYQEDVLQYQWKNGSFKPLQGSVPKKNFSCTTRIQKRYKYMLRRLVQNIKDSDGCVFSLTQV